MSTPNGKVETDRRSSRGESPRRIRSYSRERSEKHRERRERDERKRASRSRDRYKSDRRSRSRDRSRHRDRDRDRDRDRERDHDKDRERERRHDRHRDRDRDRDREDRERKERRRKRDEESDRPVEDGRPKRKRDESDQDVATAGAPALSNDDNISVTRSDRRDRSHDSERKHSDRERHSSRHSKDDGDRPPPPKDDRDRDARRRAPPPRGEEPRASFTPPVRRPSPSYDGPIIDSDNEPEVEDADSEARSVFVSQLAARLTARDLGFFFEDKLGDGTVKDARIVTDRLSKRSKGIGYVEFRSLEHVPKAIALSGTIVMGLPIMVQLTESERNKTHPGDNISSGGGSSHGSQIYVGSLHFNLTESDIKQVFEPFGELDFVDLHRDPMTGRSKGYCFIQYKRADDARMALEQMEGFELAGRQLRVKTVHEKGSSRSQLTDALDEGTGGNLNAASRQALMQKLARTEQPLSRTPEPVRPASIPQQQESRCVLLKNMFDPDQETEPNWDRDLAEDVKEECERQYGHVDRLKIERDSEGEIYVRFGSIDTAKKAVKGLNGRWFGGRQVSAHYISDAIMQAHQ